MLTLDIEYLSYICQKSLTVNNHLSNRYNQYSDNIRISESLNYYRLSDLIQYMYNINYLMSRFSIMLKETFLCYPKLSDYQLEDSRMVSFMVDNKNHTCSITLEDVLLYNEKRINKSMSVDCGTVKLTFKNTKKVEVKGQINAESSEANKVYKWHLKEIEEKLLSFCLLILNGNIKVT